MSEQKQAFSHKQHPYIDKARQVLRNGEEDLIDAVSSDIQSLEQAYQAMRFLRSERKRRVNEQVEVHAEMRLAAKEEGDKVREAMGKEVKDLRAEVRTQIQAQSKHFYWVIGGLVAIWLAVAGIANKWPQATPVAPATPVAQAAPVAPIDPPDRSQP